jgi:hypothetical protein
MHKHAQKIFFAKKVLFWKPNMGTEKENPTQQEKGCKTWKKVKTYVLSPTFSPISLQFCHHLLPFHIFLHPHFWHIFSQCIPTFLKNFGKMCKNAQKKNAHKSVLSEVQIGTLTAKTKNLKKEVLFIYLEYLHK